MEDFAFEEIKAENVSYGDILCSYERNNSNFLDNLKMLIFFRKLEYGKIYGVNTDLGVLVYKNNKVVSYPLSYFIFKEKINVILRRHQQVFTNGAWIRSFDKKNVEAYAKYIYSEEYIKYGEKICVTSNNFCKLCLTGLD